MQKEVQRTWGGRMPIAWNWRAIAGWRWAVWATGVLCAVISFDSYSRGTGLGVLGYLAAACFLVSVPPWRWPWGRAARSRAYYDAVADYAKRRAAARAAQQSAGLAPDAVRDPPARFRNEGLARYTAYRDAVRARPSSALAVADTWERLIRLLRDLERFAAEAESQAKTAEEQTYAAELRGWIARRMLASRVFATAKEQALDRLIEQIRTLGPTVPEALIDARRAELAAFQTLHRAFMAWDPEAARQAALACVAVKRDVLAREREAFGTVRNRV